MKAIKFKHSAAVMKVSGSSEPGPAVLHEPARQRKDDEDKAGFSARGTF